MQQVYVNILGEWTKLDDNNSLIDDKPIDDFVAYKLNAWHEPENNNFVHCHKITHESKLYIVHPSHLQIVRV